MPNYDECLNIPGQVLAERSQLQLPSRPEWIEPTVEFLKQKAILSGACSPSRSGNLLIALHEALTNSIVHGNLEVSSQLKEHSDDSFMQLLASRAADPNYSERRVELLVDYDGSRCRWTITDEGPGFDVEAVFAQLNSDDPEVLLASGRGILLMRSFMDDVQYELGGRRVILTLLQESGQERRQKQRVAMHTRLEVAPIRPDGSVDWEAAQEAIARDLSQDGLSLIQSQLAQTDRIIIGIFSGAKPIYIPAEIRHCRLLGKDTVELGCRFQPNQSLRDERQLDSPHELLTAIDQLLESTQSTTENAKEQRSFRRFPYTKRVEILIAPDSPPQAGYARNLSRGGVAFLTTQPLSGKVSVVFSAPDPQPGVQVRAEVVRCTKLQDNLYDVGARFCR